MGNNMAVTRKAYDAVGGYEAIPFSITEDYALFRAILDKGFRFGQLFDRRVLAISKPTPTLSELLIQRKRWMYGAVSIPWGQRLGVYFNGLLLPFLVVSGFFFPQVTLFLIFLSYVSITAWLVGILNWLQRPQLFIGLPFFWFYHVFINFVMLINFYVRKSTVWKGRKY
jgi:1,2-diacylglycerol 3-beta-glucosyltransferase